MLTKMDQNGFLHCRLSPSLVGWQGAGSAIFAGGFGIDHNNCQLTHKLVSMEFAKYDVIFDSAKDGFHSLFGRRNP
jgi:hypothetical protein